MLKRVVIIGAGPSGVLLAHYLLRRDADYYVEVYERRSDPRTLPLSQSRTFPLVLNERGIKALSKLDGMLADVKAVSLEGVGSLIHQENGKTLLLPRRKPLLFLNRTQLVITLLKTLTAQYSNDRLNIHFDHQCKRVDFETKTVNLEKTAGNCTVEVTVDYDLLIGADGARSRVREQFLSTNDFELEQRYTFSAYKSIFLPSESGTSLKSGYMHHWRASNGMLAVLMHDINGLLVGVVNFLRKDNTIGNLSTKEEVLQFFYNYFPEIAQLLPESEAEAFLNRPISNVLRIRCNPYHHGESVLLIGDAAHATSHSLGQGCNASFEDVAFFDELLNEYSDNIAEAIAQFTLRRKPDAHALVELSDYTFPLSGKLLFFESFIRKSF